MYNNIYIYIIKKKEWNKIYIKRTTLYLRIQRGSLISCLLIEHCIYFNILCYYIDTH